MRASDRPYYSNGIWENVPQPPFIEYCKCSMCLVEYPLEVLVSDPVYPKDKICVECRNLIQLENQ
jgi:hypothetical protein